MSSLQNQETGAGKSEITSSDRLDTYLSQLEQYTKKAQIYIYIFDDKANSGNSADKESVLRKSQVNDYNREHGTEYSVHVELVVTHFRFPEVPAFIHSNVDRITLLDTVPFIPPLHETSKEVWFW